MAQINFTIPDQYIDRVLTAFCDGFGYQAEITDDVGNTSPNPETRATFTKRMIAGRIKQVIHEYEGDRASNMVRQAKYEEVNAISIT